MEKPTLKVAYDDFWPEWKQENFVQPILEKKYNVVVDQQNPDVLFHSIFNRMQNTPKYKCKKVLILAENWRPGQFGSHFSISFDPKTDTNFRLPLWQIYWLLWPELKERLFNRLNHPGFERFCSFTVSNGSNFMRNAIFQQLNDYKRVHSYGRFMTNTQELQQASQGRYWRDAKDEFFKAHPHQFSITYENTPTPYYCTEKLMDAFLVGSMPIYWGDSKVGQDWNEKAFINATKLGSGVVDKVKRLDHLTDEFQDMYFEPVFTDDQKSRHLATLEEFEDWLLKIVK